MDHRLKSNKKIEYLFEKGQQVFAYPVKVVWASRSNENSVPGLQYGVSVSKRNFKKAVDRNRIKRQMREALREVIVKESRLKMLDGLQVDIMFVYVGKELLEYKVIRSGIRKVINKIH
ncbi:MAG: ribonuclease P protein component [Saprospiraceae bacterium]|nr:ribonuclease P protein component [Saprospiraceae bacterium]